MVTTMGGFLLSKYGRIQCWKQVLPSSFALLALSALTTGNEISCEASAPEGYQQIACHFSQNINKTKTSFGVYHFTPNGTSMVLACNWLDDQLACIKEQGFKTPKRVSNWFITKVEGDVHGDFGCDVLPRSNYNIRRCKLSVPHKGSAKPSGDLRSNTSNIPSEAKDNNPGNKDPNQWEQSVQWILGLLCLVIVLLTLWICLMKLTKSTDVCKKVLQWCRHKKETPYTKSEIPDASQNSAEVFQPLNDAINCRKLETQNDYQTSLVNESEQVSTQPDYIGAIPIRPFISVSDERQTPDENKPLSPHIPEKAPSHQNGSVKQSGPLYDISVSVQRRTPDEKLPWSSFGPEKFRNDMCSASMHY